MIRHNAIALAVSGLSLLAACSTVSGPERPALAERAGKVEPLMTVRNSGGVDSQGMYSIGRYFQGQMRYDDAIGAYRKALGLDPANVEARNALGVVYSIQGLAAEAEQAFRAAIAMSPNASHLHGNLGYHFLQLGRTEEARAALREALRLNPANARALTNLAAAGGEVAAPLAVTPTPANTGTVNPSTATTAAAPVEHAPVVPAPVVSGAAIAAQPALPAVASSPAAAVVSTAAPVAAASETTTPVVPVVATAPVVAAAAAESVVVAPEASTVTSVAAISPATAAVAFEAKPVATIAELIGAKPATPAAQLVGLTPNVWELRPTATGAEASSAASIRAGVPQAENATPVAAVPTVVRFEISNGNGVTGLARRVGDYLRTLGMNSPRLTNQRPFDQRRTAIQYVQGMEMSALELRATLGTPADLVMTPKIERNAQLRVVLGRDFHEIEAVARMRRGAVRQLALAPGLASR